MEVQLKVLVRLAERKRRQMLHKLQQKATSENQMNPIKLIWFSCFFPLRCALPRLVNIIHLHHLRRHRLVAGSLSLRSPCRGNAMLSAPAAAKGGLSLSGNVPPGAPSRSFTGRVAANLWDSPVSPRSLMEDERRFCWSPPLRCVRPWAVLFVSQLS